MREMKKDLPSMKDNMLAVLDVGSSKAAALIGEVTNSGRINVQGIGYAPCRGIEQGTVVDITATEEAMKKALIQAEEMAGVEIKNIYLGSGGIHISGQSSHGSAAIKNREVSVEDVEEAVDAAKAVAYPHDEMLLHALPQNFTVDRQTNIRKPIRMAGVRLEVNVYLISGLSNIIRNLRKCVARTGLHIERIVVEQFADSCALLGQDERQSGVCLINIGAGTTKTVVLKDGAPIFTSTVAMGGENVTNDVAAALRIPARLAEDVKLRYGCALVDKVRAEDLIYIPRIDHRAEQEMTRQNLASFIQPRYEEILSTVDEQLIRAGVKESIRSGIVLCGGAAEMEGLSELSAEIMHIATKIGRVDNLEDNEIASDNPNFVTAVGLLLYGFDERMRTKHKDGFFHDHNFFGKFTWFSKLHHWMEKNFY